MQETILKIRCMIILSRNNKNKVENIMFIDKDDYEEIQCNICSQLKEDKEKRLRELMGQLSTDVPMHEFQIIKENILTIIDEIE